MMTQCLLSNDGVDNQSNYENVFDNQSNYDIDNQSNYENVFDNQSNYDLDNKKRILTKLAPQ